MGKTGRHRLSGHCERAERERERRKEREGEAGMCRPARVAKQSLDTPISLKLTIQTLDELMRHNSSRSISGHVLLAAQCYYQFNTAVFLYHTLLSP